MRSSLLTFALSCLCLMTFGQYEKDYQRLKSKAPIPNDILQSSTDKYNKIKNGFGIGQKKTELDFHLKNTFVLDELLSSNRILFNDPISVYVKQVIDELMKAQGEQEGDVKVYIIKSSSINAFASDRGEIFVNLGLVAHVRNEAELAFVLCHELQHFFKQHNLNTFLEFDKIEKGRGEFRRKANYEKLLSKHSYNQELETEADELGLELFAKSKYDLMSAARVMEMLQYPHIPYQELTFDYSLLEVGDFQFSDEYKPDSLNIIKSIKDEDEELSSHPNPKKREYHLLNMIASLEKEGKEERKKFLISETEFEKIQEMARFEICFALLEAHSFAAAIYHAHLLLDKYPNNVFLKKIIGQSLYGISKYRLENQTNRSMNKDGIQGEMYRVFYLFDEMSDTEVAALASLYTWKLYKEYPKERLMSIIRRDIIEDLAMKQDDFFDYFKEDSSKGASFEKGIFGDIIKDSTFIEIVEKGFEYQKRKEARENEPKKKDRNIFGNSKEDINGLALGIDTIIVTTPTYVKGRFSRFKGGNLNLLASEKMKLQIKGMMEKSGAKLDLHTNVLDINNLDDASTIEAYHDLLLINNWTDNFLGTDFFMINPYTEDMFDVVEKYNTDKIAFFGVIDIQVPKRWETLDYVQMISLLYPASAPLGVDFLFPSHESLVFMIVVDFGYHRVLMSQVNYSKMPMKKGILKSNLYRMLYQIKSEK